MAPVSLGSATVNDTLVQTTSSTLVLSGGASKGDFEVGALQYMYEQNFFAKAICSTSVGSVNGCQLAHGGDPASQKAAFDSLKMIWQNEMMTDTDMYTLAPWLHGLSPRTLNAIADLYSGQVEISPLVVSAIFCPPLLIGQVAAAGIDLNEALNGLKTAQSVYTLDPVRTKLSNHLNPAKVAQSGVELRLVTVSLNSGVVRYVTQDGHVLNTDGTKVPGSPVGVCSAEAAIYQSALNAYAASGFAVQQAIKSGSHSDRLEAEGDRRKAAAKMAQAKEALDKCQASAQAANNMTDLVVSVADGVIASASIPCFFPPVMLGNESYVDGGIRWQLPLKTALGLDSDTIVAINTDALSVPPPGRSFATANLLDIGERSVFGLLLWETVERHLELARVKSIQQGKRVWVIAPRIDLHDGFSIDPGLIDISLGYGYMCAADILTEFPFTHVGPIGAGDRTNVLTGAHAKATWTDIPSNSQLAMIADAIGTCRRRCWDIEHDVFGKDYDPGPLPLTPRPQLNLVPNADLLDELRLLKALVGVLVDARRLANGKLPADAVSSPAMGGTPAVQGWADRWELHQWAPDDVPGVGSTPWMAYDTQGGTRPAAMRPSVLLVKRSSSSDVFLLDPTKHLVAPGSSTGGPVQTIPDEVGWILDAIPSGSPIS